MKWMVFGPDCRDNEPDFEVDDTEEGAKAVIEFIQKGYRDVYLMDDLVPSDFCIIRGEKYEFIPPQGEATLRRSA